MKSRVPNLHRVSVTWLKMGHQDSNSPGIVPVWHIPAPGVRASVCVCVCVVMFCISIQGMGSANERWRCIVTTPLIVWAHTQNVPHNTDMTPVLVYNLPVRRQECVYFTQSNVAVIWDRLIWPLCRPYDFHIGLSKHSGVWYWTYGRAILNDTWWNGNDAGGGPTDMTPRCAYLTVYPSQPSAHLWYSNCGGAGSHYALCGG